MNKELIKKYQTEFDHWLNGGELLTSIDKINWEDVTDNNSWSNIDRVYIINDKYIEFRKALAEGKTIQVKNRFDCFWQDLPNPKFTRPITDYRINPEEPQFKVGDFVRVIPKSSQAITNDGTSQFIGRIRYISGNQFNIGDENTIGWFLIEDFIKWEPQAGELCWFTHDIGVKNVGYLKEFKEISADTSYRDCYGNKWRYCEPFLNSKPSWFKE